MSSCHDLYVTIESIPQGDDITHREEGGAEMCLFRLMSQTTNEYMVREDLCSTNLEHFADFSNRVLARPLADVLHHLVSYSIIWMWLI